MAVQCRFSYDYICTIFNQDIPSEVREETFQGVDKNYHKVLRLSIENSNIEKFPDKIGEVFKNVTHLDINNSNLKKISKEDLRQFPKLQVLNLSDNKLEYLPGDLFEFNKKLIKWIYFQNNKIKFIGPELLDGLPNLYYVNLENNQNINSKYDYYDASNILNHLKEEIKKCKPSPETVLQQENELQALKQEKKDENNATKNQEKIGYGQINFLKDLNKLLTLDDFKDFTIKVGSKDFKVHKFIFIARSPTFANFVKNNPDADELVLTDIPVEVFESILDFVYTDQPPKDTRNVREIFAAAGKLKIQSLVEISAEILIKEMEKEENLEFLIEILNLGVKFECQELKLKAFEGIKKHFPGGELKNN